MNLLLDNLHLLPFLTAILSAFYEVAIRGTQREKDRSWSIALLGSWLGALAISPFLFSQFPPITTKLALLFLAQGASWAIAVYLDNKSMAYSDAVSNVLISTLRVVLLASVGLFFFEEAWAARHFLGAVLVLLGTTLAIAPEEYHQPRGLLYRLVATVFTVIATVIDKVLVQEASLVAALFIGYFVPGVFFLIVRPTTWREELTGLTKSSVAWFSLAVFLYVAVGPILVASFGLGDISSTFVISQSKIILVLILAQILLKERKHSRRRWVWSLVTMLGVFCFA